METYIKIELEDEGSFLSNSDLSYLDLACKITVLEGISGRDAKLDLNILNEYTLTNNDKFYFLPGVVIPRIKLKDIANSHNIRTVRDVDVATTIFIGNKTIDKITDVSWQYACTTSKFLEFIEAANDASHITTYYYDKIKDALEFYTNDVIFISYSTMRLLDHNDIPYQIVGDNLLNNGSKAFATILDEHVELYKQIKGKDVYSEECLLQYINGVDAVDIDLSMYNTLSDMFNSSDSDNWTLAMEVMANSDYIKSLLYTCFLMHYQGNKISSIKSRNHVNFKSLCVYLDISPNYPTMIIDEIVNTLISKKAITEDNINIVLKEFGAEIKRGSTNHFKVKTITMSDEVNSLLNKEMLFDVKPEFKPEIIITNELTNTDDFNF